MTATQRHIQVESARDLGRLFVENPHRMVGQDGAFSIPLSPGVTLWFFGDTLIGRRPPPTQSLWTIDGQPVGPRDMTGRGTFERMLNNTGLVLRHKTGADPLDEFKYITDATRKLRELAEIPTLVVSAGEDPIAPPRFGRALASALPGARFVEFPDASHGLPIHRAAEVNALLREHLVTADASRADRP